MPRKTYAPPKKVKFICKFCKVEVLSRYDKRAVLGKSHKRGCPRHRNLD
jgi:hypothetical protein